MDFAGVLDAPDFVEGGADGNGAAVRHRYVINEADVVAFDQGVGAACGDVAVIGEVYRLEVGAEQFHRVHVEDDGEFGQRFEFCLAYAAVQQVIQGFAVDACKLC